MSITSEQHPAGSRLSIPPLTAEEEDAVIHTRIVNDEKNLRRVLKRFYTYVSLAHAPSAPLPGPSATVEDAREAFLMELASFQLSLKKSSMICEAEARDVEEYRQEKQRIEEEHTNLRVHIEQLKTSLEEAQQLRRQKIEYDQIAEKINKLQTREQLEESIQALENEMTEIQAEHDTQTRLVQAQKTSLATVIADLNSLRLMGKESDASRLASPAPGSADDAAMEATNSDDPMTGKPEREEGEEGEASMGGAIIKELNPSAAPFTPSGSSGQLGNPTPRTPGKAVATPSYVGSPANLEDDIEMGEVSEGPKDGKGKRKVREELEEGEASDLSSELSELPDD